MGDSVEWFYVSTAGEQLGPVAVTELKTHWENGQLDDSCLGKSKTNSSLLCLCLPYDPPSLLIVRVWFRIQYGMNRWRHGKKLVPYPI